MYGDKTYDNRKNFNILDDMNADPAISIRKNATSTRANGCPLRREEVLLIKKLGYEGWKQLKDSGRRMDLLKNSLLFNQKSNRGGFTFKEVPCTESRSWLEGNVV